MPQGCQRCDDVCARKDGKTGRNGGIFCSIYLYPCGNCNIRILDGWAVLKDIWWLKLADPMTDPMIESMTDPMMDHRQNYSTPPGGMRVGWNSKWVGWIPPVAIPNPDQPTLAIFLTHHYFCTEKELIQIMILSIFGILGEKVKLSSRTCLLHLVPQINLVFSHFGDCSRA